MAGKTGQHIFITDDDQDDIEFLSIALRRAGYTGSIGNFSHGGVLMSHLLQHPDALPDMIVMDINMPVKNGCDTLEALMQHNRLRAIPVIMLTSSIRKQDEMQCYAMGCIGYHSKPSSLAGYSHIAASIMNSLANGWNN